MNQRRLLRELVFIVCILRLSLSNRFITAHAIDDLLRDEHPREWLTLESVLMPKVIGSECPI